MRPAPVPLSRPPQSYAGGNLGGAQLQPDPLVRPPATSSSHPSRAGIGLREEKQWKGENEAGENKEIAIRNDELQRIRNEDGKRNEAADPSQHPPPGACEAT